MNAEPFNSRIRNADFSAAFEKMCNFVAISETKSSVDTLGELILQSILLLPEETIRENTQLKKIISDLFGLKIEITDLESALDNVLRRGDLVRTPDQQLVIPIGALNRLKTRLDDALALEERVRNKWFDEIRAMYPDLDVFHMWRALRVYMAKCFKRHGMQTVAYLDPSVTLPENLKNSLRSLSREAIREVSPQLVASLEDAQDAIAAFFTGISSQVDRITYITQLADGAFNYYTLTVDPAVAADFRRNLEPCDIFLDTNFLFGILRLHQNAFVDVSIQIIESIEKYNLPFKLWVHPETQREFEATVDFYGDRLRRHTWSPSISRAAVRVPSISGIEARYHQLNAEHPILVSDFMAPYEHLDVLLKEQGIEQYTSGHSNRLEEKADLLADYNDYLDRKGKFKGERQVDHDTALLDQVHELGEITTSTLTSGAMILTCDGYLYGFETEYSQKARARTQVLLPNLFMQLIRPFVPATEDFERSFAETFAIPEFRIIGSGAAEAASRMAGLLAVYSDMSEETATRLLSNQTLLNRLSHGITEDDAHRLIEAEIVLQNTDLLEENEELQRDIRERKYQVQAMAEQLGQAQSRIADEVNRTNDLKQLLESSSNKVMAEESKFKAEQEARIKAEQAADAAKKQAELLERQKQHLRTILEIGISAASGVFAMILLNYLPWEFLVNHPQRGPILIISGIVVGLVVFVLLNKRWRKHAVLSAALLLLVGVLLDKL